MKQSSVLTLFLDSHHHINHIFYFELATRPSVMNQICYIEIWGSIIISWGMEMEPQRVNRVLGHTCQRLLKVLWCRVTLLLYNCCCLIYSEINTPIPIPEFLLTGVAPLRTPDHYDLILILLIHCHVGANACNMTARAAFQFSWYSGFWGHLAVSSLPKLMAGYEGHL